MSRLLIKPNKPNENRRILSVTPDDAGWKYVGFEVFELREGDEIRKETLTNEVCIVFLSGMGKVKTSFKHFSKVGKRMSVFEKTPPYSVYVPNNDFFQVTALTDLSIAICYAPGKGSYEARLISPDDVDIENRGYGKMSRRIHNILPETKPADSLLVVEVFTPDGNTSSYPPHKHDRDNLPEESYLEETYYHEINPNQGFVFQRVYNDSRTLNETICVEHKNVVLVPEGYHPVTTLPGYESYYLNVMAGPVRTWKFYNDPAHEWILNKKAGV
jgi:5-deoxy-glucuronate isomerase